MIQGREKRFIMLAALMLLAVALFAGIVLFFINGAGISDAGSARVEQLNVAKGMIVVGMSASILLFSVVLYGGKRSEKYLLWLAILSYTTMVRTAMNTLPFLADYPVINVLFLGKLPYLGSAYPIINNNLHRLIMLVLVNFLRYRMMKCFFDVRIFGKNYFAFIAVGAAVTLISAFTPAYKMCLALLYILIYACELTVLLRDNSEMNVYVPVIVFALGLTIALRSYDFLCELGFLGGKFEILRNRFNGIIESFSAVAFFIITCLRFADKFRETDELNITLETQIKEKTEQKTALVRSLLHNLKTPLFTLSGYLDIIEATPAGRDAQTAKYIEKMSGSVDYVCSMLDHVFLLTQLDDGRISFQAVPFDFRSLVEKVAETTELKAGERKITVELDAESYPCLADPLYYEQAVQNLADNALNHTSTDGAIAFRLVSDKDSYVLKVSDNGEGISPENIGKVFDRYFSDHHGRRNSSGLGLSISKEIVEQQGGSISVESELGKGTAFTLCIPSGS